MDGNAPYFTRSIYFIAANLLIIGLSRKIGDENAIVQEIGMRLMCSHYMLSEMINIIEATSNHLCQLMDKYQKRTDLTHVLEYIERHINSYALSLQRIADEFDMSASTFSKMFKEKSGLSFKEYVDGLRISKAKKMLQDTNIPIERVASEIGYETVTSFYRWFKKHIGIAPGEYRIAAAMKQEPESKN
jgi:YesN/AraC family two-component response regulator